MRLPSWNEVNEKISNFEKKTMEIIRKIKEDHPIVAGALSGLIDIIIPPPLDSIAHGIFDNADGSEVDKTNAVLGYFKNLQLQGENHYNQIATKLDSVLFNINDLKQITAKEDSLQLLQEIFISNSKTVDTKLNGLKNILLEMNEKMDRVVGFSETSLKKLDEILSKMQALHYDKTNWQMIKESYDKENTAFVIGEECANFAAGSYDQLTKNEFEGRKQKMLYMCEGVGLTVDRGMASLIKQGDSRSLVKFYTDFSRKVSFSLSKNLIAALSVGQTLISLVIVLAKSEVEDVSSIIKLLKKDYPYLLPDGPLSIQVKETLNILSPYEEIHKIPLEERQRILSSIFKIFN